MKASRVLRLKKTEHGCTRAPAQQAMPISFTHHHQLDEDGNGRRSPLRAARNVQPVLLRRRLQQLRACKRPHSAAAVAQ